MGQQVSRVYGFLVKRPLQRFNVDHRAEKMVTKFEDPNAAPYRAPMFMSDAQLLEEIRKENPEVLSATTRKDDELHQRLKSVYVSSTDPRPEEGQDTETKPLPRDITQHYQDFVPAQMRVERPGFARTLPRGKVSLDQSVEFLTKYSRTRGEFGVPEISNEYRLNPEVVKHILQYYNIFNVMETKTREAETDRPDPLQAGPTWEVSSDDPRKKEVEEMEKIIAMKDKQKVRLETEKRKHLDSGVEKSP